MEEKGGKWGRRGEEAFAGPMSSCFLHAGDCRWSADEEGREVRFFVERVSGWRDISWLAGRLVQKTVRWTTFHICRLSHERARRPRARRQRRNGISDAECRSFAPSKTCPPTGNYHSRCLSTVPDARDPASMAEKSKGTSGGVDTTSGVARNVNWWFRSLAFSLSSPAPFPCPPLLTGDRGYNPGKFLEIKGARR